MYYDRWLLFVVCCSFVSGVLQKVGKCGCGGGVDFPLRISEGRCHFHGGGFVKIRGALFETAFEGIEAAASC